MAKYIKKRKISLRDIIFKTGKTTRENLESSDITDRELLEPSDFLEGNGSGPNDIPDVDFQQDNDHDDDGAFADDFRACSPEVTTDRIHAIIVTENAEPFREESDDRVRHPGSNSIQTPSDESDKSFDGNKAEHSPFCSQDEADNNFIISKYFDSLTVSNDEGTLSKVGLPVIDTRSSRSLSAIPWSEVNRGSTLTNSRSCYEICSNKIPGTQCEGNCSTPMSRRRYLYSPSGTACSSRTASGDEAVDVIPLDAVTTSTPLRREKLSRRMKIQSVPLKENRAPFDDEHDFAQQVSTKLQMRPPSSLHVSPNMSPNISTSASVSLSPLVSPTLPSDFSPFNPRGPCKPYLSTRPKSAQLPPLRGSASNPNLLHSDSTGLIKKVSTLEVKAFPSVSRSNPNLYLIPRSPESGLVGGTSADNLQTSRLTPSPKPTPPPSPRPSSRGRRAPRVKVSGTISQDELDSI